MKKIYFVRHGQSEGNVGNLRGHEEHPLTPEGRLQAAFVAKRCSALPIDAIISSTMVRARDTTAVIADSLNLAPEYSSLFIEALAPSISRGKSRKDPEVLAVQKIINENYETPGYHYADEENFEDLNERARLALEALAQKEGECILVVTHGFFMRIIMARVVRGDSLTAKDCKEFIRAFHMENTGLTVLGYDERVTNPWWVWVWNDHAHLG